MSDALHDIGTLIESAASLDLDDKVQFINEVREMLHAISPFKSEPVDFVRWVRFDAVCANDYNPNSVAPPEMELLRLSIMADGYTQPIVAMPDEGGYTVIDGFHRNRVGRECEDVKARIHGYLPVVRIKPSQEDRSDRIASTIRHNRARGKHKVEAMSDIVVELKRRNWSDDRIGKELGMDPDEVLRLTQISGLAELFANDEFSSAWEHSGEVAPEGMDDETVNLEWFQGLSKADIPEGWHNRSETSAVLYGPEGVHRGVIQKSRFNDEWFCYAYAQPMIEGRAETEDQAKAFVEANAA